MASLRPLDWPGAVTALGLAALWGANPVAVKVGLADAPPGAWRGDTIMLAGTLANFLSATLAGILL